MQISPSAIDAIYYAFTFGFQTAVMQVSQLNFWQKVATEYPSKGRENRYPWIERSPKMREWFGERQYNNLKARAYILKNRKFETSSALERDDVEDDTYGIFAAQNIPNMAMQVARNTDFLLQDAMQNGDSTSDSRYQAFDGQTFFNTSHPVDMDDTTKGTYANKFTAKPLNGTNLDYVRTQMRAYKAIDGTPLGVMPSLLVAAPANEVTAAQVLKSGWTSPASALGQNAANAPSENVLKGMMDLAIFDLLTGDDTTWYMLDTRLPVKPFVRQLRRANEFVFMNRLTDPNVFEKEQFLFGASVREAVGYSLPFLAAKVYAT